MQQQLGNPYDSITTPVFCQHHMAEGQRIYKQIGESGIMHKSKRAPNRGAFAGLSTKKSVTFKMSTKSKTKVGRKPKAQTKRVTSN